MPKRTIKKRSRRYSKKQKVWNMRGCSKKNCSKKSFLHLGHSCSNCGPKCRCGSSCSCSKGCKGKCYMNRRGGASNSPIAPYPINGGQLMVSPHMNGGFYKPAAPIPGPFIGSSWNGQVNNWPGVNGIGSDKNYLPINNYASDISRQMKLYSGGGLIPQDLVNLGRSLTYNAQSAYNTINGYSSPVNPLPYKDQLMKK